MPVFSSKDSVRSGVPLGGIGAGKLEILPNGLLNAFTFQNNWSKPLAGDDAYPGVLGYHFGVFVQPRNAARGRRARGKKVFLLQTVPIQGIPTAAKIRYEGTFPTARLSYDLPGTGLDLSLEARSSWIPGDPKNSALPAVFFEFHVRNRNRFAVNVGILFIGRNVSGKWCVGRRNKIYQSRKHVDLEFSNTDPSPRDVRHGTLRFRFSKRGGWKPSFMESWNAVTKNFHFNSRSISLAAWEFFRQKGTLPDTRQDHVVRSENQELCGAVAMRQNVPRGKSRKLSLCASWYFARHPLGHRYEKWFAGAASVASYAVGRGNRLKRKTAEFQSAVFSLPFPRWFNDALLTSLAPFFSATWYVKDGRFAFYEAPMICPLMGTLDVGFYGSIPLSYFFPELEISQIRQFGKAQRPDGYVPHDLGKSRLDMPSDGTTLYPWKDLNPKFVLMVYRDTLWSGDRRFLKELYPCVKKAVDWTLKNDWDGNGLPDHEGADQTFDLWDFYGTNAYTAGIFLAALLAAEKMAGLAGDRRFSGKCRDGFLKGRRSFERELWNGRYFGNVCALSQLNGQWYAGLLGLGAVADKRKIRTALRAILKCNARHSRFGMVNSVLADGRLDASNDHSKNVWSGMNYAFASLCVLEGFGLSLVLNPVRKIWDNVVRMQKNPWNQPDTIDSRTGRYVFGDSYYRNMAIWSIPIAHAIRDQKTARILKTLRRIGAEGNR